MTRRELWGKAQAQTRKCCYCEVDIPRAEVTREHIIPKSKGGRLTAPCCYACNQEKKDMLLIDFLIKLMKNRRNMRKPKVIKKCDTKIKNSIKFLLLLYPGEYNFLLY